MCAPNKIKKVKRAFSHLFRMHLAITISAMKSGHLGAMSRMEVFLSSMNRRLYGIVQLSKYRGQQ